VRVLLLIGIVAMVSFSIVQPTAAAPGIHLNWGTQLNAAECDKAGGTLVINVTHHVVNDIDSAVGGGFWAVDEYNRHIQVWFLGTDGNGGIEAEAFGATTTANGVDVYCAVVKYQGSFVTDDGPSPGGSDQFIAAGIEGTFEGGYRAVITGPLKSNPTFRSRGFIGSFNYGCNVETDPGNRSTCTGLFNWLSEYFDTADSNFNYTLQWWGWIYKTGRYGTWVNASTGNQGDITDGP